MEWEVLIKKPFCIIMAEVRGSLYEKPRKKRVQQIDRKDYFGECERKGLSH